MKTGGAEIKGYRRLIPSMTALVEFEAVARLSSFTLAAHELGVTQAAASRQIKLLEETLGVKLFQRLHRAIKLTPEGEALYATVSESMQKIAAAFDRIASGNQQQELVLAATAAFSQFRVLPRVPALKLLLPSVTLRLITQMFTADLLHKEIDVAVRFGNGKWQDGTAFPLFDEEVFPVCSPAWLAATGGPPTLDALAAMPLIESDSTSEGWMGWSEWFHRLGLRQPHLNFSFRCSLYTDAIQVARSGQGVALGWGRLVSDLLASGELVRLGTAAFKASDAYYIVVPAGRTITPVMEDLINLLRTDFPGLQGFDPD